MLLGMTSGVLGSFALLRRQSLIGDAMSHAALPGICIAFIIVGSKEMIFLVLGAGITAYFGTFFDSDVRETFTHKDRHSNWSRLVGIFWNRHRAFNDYKSKRRWQPGRFK
ncbi:metal ABC transporter permease [Geomicrobium sp. JCM 19037]|uniref:metal ABC transporter permease n=1 Tax=Geomicrobium sp. JCM 19037 TaxID=1460634 RepID=UPI0027D8C630|nr:metal ABC transporter permease [Geomicrobium sp. JCM 19037]